MKLAICALLLCLAVFAHAGNEINLKGEAALAAESRPPADRDRDQNRLAVETLNFFGLKDDMQVLELMPGRGWYTRVLAPILTENGHLSVALGTGRVTEGVLKEVGFEDVTRINSEDNLRRPDSSRFYVVDEFDFGIKDLDMVLTFRNLHNFGAKSRLTINKAVFESLKSGGLYGVVDHTRRHMQTLDNENRRRIDPVLVVKEMLDLGFEFVDFSDLHYRADDELEYEVGRRSVSGNTDRFTFLFRKP